MKTNSLGLRVGLGYALMMLMLALAIGITIWQVDRIVATSGIIKDKRVPEATASQSMISGVNRSLAALRGWVLLGDERFKKERARAWNDEMDPALEVLRHTLPVGSSSENAAGLRKLESLIKTFRQAQQEVEDVAQTRANRPASQMLAEQAEPEAGIIASSITQMIDLERTAAASGERGELLRVMVGFRDCFNLANRAIRAYLLTGDTAPRAEFDHQWESNTEQFTELGANEDLLTPQQAGALHSLAEARSKFESLTAKILEIRSSNQWNVANDLLATKIVPAATEIGEIMQAMVRDQQHRMLDDFAAIDAQVISLWTIEWTLLAAGLAVCTLLIFIFTRSITKQASAVQKNEARFRSIVDTAVDGIVTITETGVVESFNKSAERLFGYTAQEIVGQNVKMLMPAPFQQEHDRYLKNYLTTNVAKLIGVGRQVKGLRKDGSTFDLYLSVGEVALPTGRFFTGIVRDITEEKRAKEALEQSNQTMERENWLKSQVARVTGLAQGVQKLEVLAQSLICELADTLEAGHGVFYALEAAKDEGEQDTLTLIGSYAYKERKNVANRFKIGEGLVGQCAREKKPIRLTSVPPDYVQINSGLGESAPLNIIAVPVLFEDKVVAVIELASFHEFTPVQQELLDQVAASLGIAIHSIRGRQRTEELLVETQRLAEQSQAQSEELQAANEELEEKTEALQQQQHELQAANEELEEKSERLAQQSEELQASNEELEEKTEALEQQKRDIERKNVEIQAASRALAEKADDLQVASRYKSEFLANMSHELRTPLNSLLILSEALADNEDGNLTEEQIQSAKIIHGGGQDLLRLINDILDLSKVEAGKMELSIEDVHLDTLIESMRRQFEPIADEKGLQLILEKADNAPGQLKTDLHRTEQILRNLLSNAFKFTSSGSVTLSARRPASDVHFKSENLTPRSAIALSVIDTGIGVTPDKQRAIFEAFQQADGSTSRDFGGTGLGLTISREMARLLGGEIHLQSQVGKGSTFTLYLPLAHAAEPLAPAPQKPVLPACLDGSNTENADATDRSHALQTPDVTETTDFVPDDRHALTDEDRSLLIIEDDPNFAKTLMSLSRKKGYKCLCAGTGRGGLRMALEYEPEAILLDLGLPDIDGLDVLDQLKKNLETRHIPVHVISGRDAQWDVLNRGAFGYLAKPTTPEDVYAALKKVQALLQAESKRVLVVEDDPATHRAIETLFKNHKVVITQATSAQSAIEILRSRSFDCIILDLNLGEVSGFEMLRRASKDHTIEMPPVVVYTGRDLTAAEHLELSQHTLSIVIKGANSPERLLDEVSLFLHSVESTLPPDQRRVMRMLHNSGDVFQGKKVLLVDDDMRNIFAISKELSQRGLEVIVADNGQLALQKLDENPEIDIVLMDIMMPVMDGCDAMRRIRQQDRFRDLPIIAVTAKAMREDREKSLQAGASDYLTKPVQTDKLLALMRVWLYGQKQLVH